jgi:hypothetical protein
MARLRCTLCGSALRRSLIFYARHLGELGCAKQKVAVVVKHMVDCYRLRHTFFREADY